MGRRTEPPIRKLSSAMSERNTKAYAENRKSLGSSTRGLSESDKAYQLVSELAERFRAHETRYLSPDYQEAEWFRHGFRRLPDVRRRRLSPGRAECHLPPLWLCDLCAFGRGSGRMQSHRRAIAYRGRRSRDGRFRPRCGHEGDSSVGSGARLGGPEQLPRNETFPVVSVQSGEK